MVAVASASSAASARVSEGTAELTLADEGKNLIGQLAAVTRKHETASHRGDHKQLSPSARQQRLTAVAKDGIR